MKDPTSLIEFRKRRIQSGKNARLYWSILYIASVIIWFIIKDVEVLPSLPLFIFLYLMTVFLMSLRLDMERKKLSKLLKNENECVK